MRHHRLTALLPFLLFLGGANLGAASRGLGLESPSQKPEVFAAPHAPRDFLPTIWRNRDGHIVRIERGNITQTFGRGTGGRITSATSNVNGAPSYSYPSHDTQGRRTAANTNRGNWTYTYRGGVNGDGQLASAAHSGSWDFEYEHDGIGRRLSFKMPDGIEQFQTGNADDPLNQFLSTQWRQEMLLRASLDREADVEITESFALPTLIPGLEPDEEEPPLRDIVHSLTPYGTSGGWTAWSITGTLEGGGDPGAAPDRKAKLAGLALFPPAEENFTYDAAGNRSGSARWNYNYDGLNRLTRAVNKDLATAPEAWDVEFAYDAEGRRHSKTSKLYRDGVLKDTTITTWIWDGWHPVIERVSDPRQNKPIVERKLVWGPDLSGQPGGAGGAGGLLLIRETNHTFDGRPPVTTDLLPLYDGSGNIVGLANPQGDLLAEYWYGPFGELLEATGPNASTNPWRWATKTLDPETGLVYFGLRYYDPATGQWLSREPLGEGESLNLYAYTHNDPINRVDVLGAAEWMNDAHNGGQAWLKWAAKQDSVILGTLVGVAASLASTPKGLVSFGEHVGTQAAFAEDIALNSGDNGTYAAVETALAELSGAKMVIESLANERVVYTRSGGGASLGFDSTLDRTVYGVGGGLNLVSWGMGPVALTRTVQPYWQGYRAGVPLRTTRLSLALSDALDSAPLMDLTDLSTTPIVRPWYSQPGMTTLTDAPNSWWGNSGGSGLTYNINFAPKGGGHLVLHPDQVIMNNYQRYYNDAWTQVVRRFNAGRIFIPGGQHWKTVLGQHTDAAARDRLRNFLSRNGVEEGPGLDVLVNRWLRDPSGSGAYRIPDVRLQQTCTILDGTIGSKTMSSQQVRDFVSFSGGNQVIIVRPTVGPLP